jgi:hypothetical protein
VNPTLLRCPDSAGGGFCAEDHTKQHQDRYRATYFKEAGRGEARRSRKDAKTSASRAGEGRRRTGCTSRFAAGRKGHWSARECLDPAETDGFEFELGVCRLDGELVEPVQIWGLTAHRLRARAALTSLTKVPE